MNSTRYGVLAITCVFLAIVLIITAPWVRKEGSSIGNDPEIVTSNAIEGAEIRLGDMKGELVRREREIQRDAQIVSNNMGRPDTVQISPVDGGPIRTLGEIREELSEGIKRTENLKNLIAKKEEEITGLKKRLRQLIPSDEELIQKARALAPATKSAG